MLFINKNKEAEGEAVQPVELIIAKHRNGETGKLTLNWIGEYVRFTDPDTFVRTEDGRETSEENARREQRDFGASCRGRAAARLRRRAAGGSRRFERNGF